MKTNKIYGMLAIFAVASLAFAACSGGNAGNSDTKSEAGAPGPGQSAVQDAESQKNIVGVAVGSPDHTTLVAAVKQAELVDALSNAGPFTVFAPTNAAFDKLPKGTVEDLMKPENKDKLSDILGYHTYVGVINTDQMTDGQSLGMVSLGNVTIKMVDGKPTVNGANIVATVPCSNGVIHVVDAVLLPPTK